MINQKHDECPLCAAAQTLQGRVDTVVIWSQVDCAECGTFFISDDGTLGRMTPVQRRALSRQVVHERQKRLRKIFVLNGKILPSGREPSLRE
jgi:hypothetical protein